MTLYDRGTRIIVQQDEVGAVKAAQEAAATLAEINHRTFANLAAFTAWKATASPSNGWTVFIYGVGLYEYFAGSNVGTDLEDWRAAQIGYNPIFRDPFGSASMRIRQDNLTAFRDVYIRDEAGQTLASDTSVAAAISAAIAGFQEVTQERVSFTPTFKLATPGDSSWSYTTQLGIATRTGTEVRVTVSLLATFTPGTATLTQPLLVDISGCGWTPTDIARSGEVTNKTTAVDLPAISTYPGLGLSPKTAIGSADVGFLIHYQIYGSQDYEAADLQAGQAVGIDFEVRFSIA